MGRRDWLLVALAAAGDSGLSPAQAQKSLFLLGKKMPHESGRDFYAFTPYSYGPFSNDVYTDVWLLKKEGLATFRPVPGRNWYDYVISPQGREAAQAIAAALPPAAVDYISKVVQWAQRQSFQGLVSAIYKMYPEFRKNSVFRD